MPLYVVDYIGSGTYRDMWRPRGSDQPGWSAIKLGKGGGSDSRALLWLPDVAAILDARLLAYDRRESLAEASRQRIENELGIVTDSRATTPQDLIRTLLLDPPGGKWNAIQPTRGRYVAYLGGTKWVDIPAIRGGAWSHYETTFAGTENPLSESGKWSGGDGDSEPHKSVAGVAEPSTTGSRDVSRLVLTVGADQYARITIANLAPNVLTAVAPVVRMAAAPDESAYVGEVFLDGVAPGSQIYEWADGFGTTILVSGGPAYANGDTVELEAVGSTLVLRRNGVKVLGPVTDATLASGEVGFYSFSGGSSTEASIDYFIGGELRRWILGPK